MVLYRLAYQNLSSAYAPAVRQLFASCLPAVCQLVCAARISTNQIDKVWHHKLDSCTLEVFRVSPKCQFAHFYLALFNKNYIWVGGWV